MLQRTWMTPKVPLDLLYKLWALIGFNPSQLQVPFFHSEAGVRVIYGGWRAGKSFLSVMALIGYLVFWKNVKRTDGLSGLIWIIGPDYKQAEMEFNYFEQVCRKLGILADVSKPARDSWVLNTVTGWRIETRSSVRLASLGSFTLDAVIIAEANQHEESVLAWAMSRLAETGGPLILSGTLEDGNPWYPELSRKYPSFPNSADLEWFSLPTWANPTFTGEDDPMLRRIKHLVPWNVWLIKYAGIPAPPIGAVWSEFRKQPGDVFDPDGKPRSIEPICHVWEGAEYDPRREVFLAVDPGEVYAICAFHWVTLFQTRRDTGKEVAMPGMLVFDEVSIPHGHFDEVRDALLEKPWFPKAGGLVTYHDRATKQHHNAKSQEELWNLDVEHGGLGCTVLYREAVLKVGTGVDMWHRWLFHPLTREPLVYFHPRCAETIKEHGQESYPRDIAHGQRADPIDKYNHHRKALTYAVNIKHGPVLQLEEEELAKVYKSVQNWGGAGF
jgi:hypothetical protein